MGKRYRETDSRESPHPVAFLERQRAGARARSPTRSCRPQRTQSSPRTRRKLHFRARSLRARNGGHGERPLAAALRLSNAEGGVGNQNDLVGRYFADHSFRDLGRILIVNRGKGPTWYQEESFLLDDQGPGKPRDAVGFATTPRFREGRKLLGFSAIGHMYSRRSGRPTARPQPSRVARPRRKHRRHRAVRARCTRDTRSIPLYLVGEQAPNPRQPSPACSTSGMRWACASSRSNLQLGEPSTGTACERARSSWVSRSHVRGCGTPQAERSRDWRLEPGAGGAPVRHDAHVRRSEARASRTATAAYTAIANLYATRRIGLHRPPGGSIPPSRSAPWHCASPTILKSVTSRHG